MASIRSVDFGTHTMAELSDFVLSGPDRYMGEVQHADRPPMDVVVPQDGGGIHKTRTRLLNDIARFIATKASGIQPMVATMAINQQQKIFRVGIVRISEHLDHQRHGASPGVQELLDDIARTMNGLNMESSSVDLEPEKSKLVGIFTQCHGEKIGSLIENISGILTQEKRFFDSLVSQYWGIGTGSDMVDMDFAQALIDFEQKFNCLEQVDRQSAVQAAYELAVLPGLHTYLIHNLGNELGRVLCLDIVALAWYEAMAVNFINHAKTNQLAFTYHFTIGLPHMSSTTQNKDPVKRHSTPASVGSKVPTLHKLSFRHTADQHLIVVSRLISEFAGTIDDFLASEDRGVGPMHLAPRAKQITFDLLQSLFRLDHPLPKSEAFWSFGYSTCRTIFQTQRLSGIYAVILFGLNDPQKAFEALWKALMNNNLHELFHSLGFGDYESNIPDLPAFLRAQPGERPSVWRLIQFVGDTSDRNPTNALGEDFGFIFCKTREEVEELKDIYDKLLRAFGWRAVHEACINGSLLHMVDEKHPDFNPRLRRLVRSINPYIPGRGYEGGRVPGRLFK